MRGTPRCSTPSNVKAHNRNAAACTLLGLNEGAAEARAKASEWTATHAAAADKQKRKDQHAVDTLSKRAKTEGKDLANRIFDARPSVDPWGPMFEEFSATDDNAESLSTSEGSNS